MMLKRITFVSLIIIVLSALFIAGCGSDSGMQLEDIETVDAAIEADSAVKDSADSEMPQLTVDGPIVESDGTAEREADKGVSAGDFYFPVGYPVEQVIDGVFYKLEMLENGQGLYRFKMTLRNDSIALKVFQFKNRERFDVSMSLGGVPKWRANLGKKFGEGPFNINFPQFEFVGPGQSRTYQIDWDGRGNNGEILPNGMYKVQGTITSSSPDRPTLSADRWYSLGGWSF